MIEEENEDSLVHTKVETAEISEPELEAVEAVEAIKPELKAEDETFDETKELGKFKAESRAGRAAPKSKDLKIVAQNL